MSEAHAQLRFPMLVLAIGMGIALAYVLVADGDLDYGQRDSVQYYSVGLSIAQGEGLTVPFGEPGGPFDLGSPTSPLQFHPPGLPLVVSPLLALGLSPLPTLVVLQATFIALLGSVIAWQVHTATGSRFRAGGAALAGWSTGVFLGNQFVTEPLYLLMVAVVIGCLLAYVRRSDSRMLGCAVVIAAAASLVRVIGVALVLPAAAAIRTTVGELRATFGKVAVVAGVVGGPVLVWILATAEHSNRSTVWHPLDLIDLKVGVSSLSVWMAPYQLSVWLRVVLAAVVTIALAVYTVKKSRAGSSPSSPLWLLWAVYGISHLGILVLVMSVADAQTRLIPRQVAPVGLAVVVAALVRTPMTRIGLVLLSPLAVAAVALGVAGFADLADETGYGEEPWVSSDAFDAVRHSDADYVLSNSPEAIWVNTGLSTYAIPTATNPWTGLSNKRLERELAKLSELMASKTIEIVLFDDMRSYLVDLQTLLDLGFVVGERFETATLLVEAAP